MAENKVQNVKIVTNNVNLRATSVRSRLTDVVTMYKCGTKAERKEALDRFNEAVEQFKIELRWA